LALGEEILGGRVGRLVIQQAIASLALHVRLAGEEENLYRLGDIGGGQRGNGQHQEGSNAGESVLHVFCFFSGAGGSGNNHLNCARSTGAS
jgi:hypothetical protein